jgi:hypothetical protein
MLYCTISEIANPVRGLSLSLRRIWTNQAISKTLKIVEMLAGGTFIFVCSALGEPQVPLGKKV